MKNIAEPFIRRRNRQPVFLYRPAAALRASEIGADVILKASKVDGIYDSDPNKNPKAKRFTTIDYSDALQRRLKIMDSTAFSICMDNNVPIVVFDIFLMSFHNMCCNKISDRLALY